MRLEDLIVDYATIEAILATEFPENKVKVYWPWTSNKDMCIGVDGNHVMIDSSILCQPDTDFVDVARVAVTQALEVLAQAEANVEKSDEEL